MGTIAEKLARLAETKADIKSALEEKGQTVTDSEPFSAYPDKIRAISGGGAGAETSTLDIAFGSALVGKPYSITGKRGSFLGTVPESKRIEARVLDTDTEYTVRAGDANGKGEAAVTTGESPGRTYPVEIATTFPPGLGDYEEAEFSFPLSVSKEELEEQFAKEIGGENWQDEAVQARAKKEAATLRAMTEGAPGEAICWVYRRFLDKEDIPENGTMDIKVEADSLGNNVRVMIGPDTTLQPGSNREDRYQRAAGVENVDKVVFERTPYLKGKATFCLKPTRLVNADGKDYDHSDRWLSGSAVEYLYFTIHDSTAIAGVEMVRYCVLELRVKDAGAGHRGIAYQEDQGYAIQVYGNRQNPYWETHAPNVTVEYQKDANGQEVYAKDLLGGYLETVTLEDGTLAYRDETGGRNIRVQRGAEGYRFTDADTGLELDEPGFLLDKKGAPVRIPADFLSDGETQKGYQTDGEGKAILDCEGRYIPRRFLARVSSKDMVAESMGGKYWVTFQPQCPYVPKQCYMMKETGRTTFQVLTQADQGKAEAAQGCGALEYILDVEVVDDGDIAEDYPIVRFLRGQPNAISDIWSYPKRDADGVFRCEAAYRGPIGYTFEVLCQEGSFVSITGWGSNGNGDTAYGTTGIYTYCDGTGELSEMPITFTLLENGEEKVYKIVMAWPPEEELI